MHGNGIGLGAGRIDMTHLLSMDQIDIVRNMTHIGDEVSFLKDCVQVEGVVTGKYKNLFTLEDGRSFTWVDYITGSPSLLHYLRAYHPIRTIRFNDSYNVYRVKAPGALG